MSVSLQTLNEFYQFGWEQRWISRLNDNFVPGDAGYKLRLFKTIGLIDFSPDRTFTLLDLGCGVGIYTIYVLRKFKNARSLSIDLSKEHVRAARELAQRAGVGNRANFVAADVSDFHVDMKPDIIFATEILEHLPEPSSAIENIKRLSTANTRVIISVPNKIHETHNNWIFYRQITGEDFQNMQTEEIEKLDKTKPKYTFYHKKYELQEIQNILIKKGFRVNKVKFCYFQYPKYSKAGPLDKMFKQKLNYVNRRLAYSFLDDLFGRLLKGKYYETIILDCRVKLHKQREKP